MIEVISQRALPIGTLDPIGQRPLGIYVHVPWCTTRCGYCDFNTYVPGAIEGSDPVSYTDSVIAEIRLMAAATERPVGASTVFFGGGTPTLLGAPGLGRILAAIRDEFGLLPEAEVTTEANPESVGPATLDGLLAAGFNRISIGMQSAVPHVLATLDRVHTPGGSVAVAQQARAAGFQQVSLDLIYGTPGESDDDWTTSVNAAIEAEPTHISAYSLIVEPNTRMARMVQRGELTESSDEVLAARYEKADDLLRQAGFDWYEVSNWARDENSICKHNLLYWHSDDWLGFGPGAHSHIAGTRWWNLKHPARYAVQIAEKRLPVADFESLDDAAQMVESIMLGLRIVDGIPEDRLAHRQSEINELVAEGILDPAVRSRGQLVLTSRGRLLADYAVRKLAF